MRKLPPTPGYSLSQFGRRARDKFLGIYGPVAHFALMRLYYDYGNGVYVAVVPSNDGLGFTNVWLGGSFGEKFKLLVQDTVTFRQKAEELRRDRFLSSRETLRFEAEQ